MDIKEEIAQLQTRLALLEEMSEYEIEGGDFYINFNGAVLKSHTTPCTRKYGIEFKTREAAEIAQVAYRKYHRLYKLAEDLNDGWEPNWDDVQVEKISLYYNHLKKTLTCCSTYVVGNVCDIYFKDKETARKAIEILRNEIRSGALVY